MAGVVTGALGCGGDSGINGGNMADTVQVSPTSSSLPVGASERLAAVALDGQGNSINGATFTWNSSNTGVATVDPNGLVHGIAAGTAQISASGGGANGSASVQVTAATGNPHLVFSTYLGGSQQDQIRDIAVDAGGNIFITGGTESSTWPGTPGTYDPTPNGNYDVFVAKISPQGQLLWSTFIGGPNYDRAYGIELDAQGYIYLAGRAGDNFPVTNGAFQTTFSGGPNQAPYGPQDGFVCKMTPDGSAIVFCSYFGTNDKQMIRDIAVDGSGAMYIASSYVSGTYPGNWFAGSYRSSPIGGMDGVIAKIAPDGGSVLWATYIGGSADEAEQPSIKVDASGNIFALYSSESADAPTPNGFDHTLSGGRDLYLVKLSNDGKQLLFGTFVGGNGLEGVETHELALDPQGNPVIGNNTTSSDFPTTSGVVQRTNLGLSDAFVMRVSASGSQILTSTLLGGASSDAAEGISIDPAGNIYVTGTTQSTLVPFLAGGVQSGNNGTVDMVMIKLSPDFTKVLYGTFLGGGGSDAGRAAAVTAAGDFIFGGTTTSSNFPTLSPIQPNPGGGGIIDAALAKISP